MNTKEIREKFGSISGPVQPGTTWSVRSLCDEIERLDENLSLWVRHVHDAQKELKAAKAEIERLKSSGDNLRLKLAERQAEDGDRLKYVREQVKDLCAELDACRRNFANVRNAALREAVDIAHDRGAHGVALAIEDLVPVGTPAVQATKVESLVLSDIREALKTVGELKERVQVLEGDRPRHHRAVNHLRYTDQQTGEKVYYLSVDWALLELQNRMSKCEGHIDRWRRADLGKPCSP